MAEANIEDVDDGMGERAPESAEYLAVAAASRAYAASSVSAVAALNPKLAQFLLKLDREAFWAWIGHADNATHFKSSGNLHWWSKRLDDVDYLRSIWLEFGCPGKGKGPWDGLGAVAKTKVRNDITNNKCRTASGRIRSALEVAEHLRTVFADSSWVAKHAHMKINEVVVFYIEKSEKDISFPKIDWPAVDPKYSTVKGISGKYSFMMRGLGRVASRRFCCKCDACMQAFSSGTGMTPRLDFPECKRRHLSSFDGTEQTITCTAAAGLANAKVRAKALWTKLKPLLRAGKFAAVQVPHISCACTHP